MTETPGETRKVPFLDESGRVPTSYLPVASTSARGLMSDADKTKLDGSTSEADPNSIVERDDDGVFSVADPTDDSHVTNKGYVDASVQEHTPDLPDDLATEEYVDTAISQIPPFELPSDLATEEYVESRVEGFATEQYVDNAVSEVPVFELPEDTATKGYVDDTAGQLRSDLGDAFIERENVKRIIVSTNVDQPMEDGDLLMVAETPSYFTNFTGYTVGEQPHDWTKRWDQSGEFTIEQDPTASGGVGLRVITNGGRTALSWDATDDDAYANFGGEIVAKWRSESPREQIRMAFQGGGEAGNEYVNFGGITQGGGGTGWLGSMVGTYRDGSANNSTASFGGDPDEIKGQEWWVTRTRLHYMPEGSTQIQTRSWKWGLPEPTEWHRTRTIGDLIPGWAGILCWVTREQGFVVDWYGASFGGGRAPMGS